MLVEFIMLMTDGDCWPTHKDMSFWEHAGRFMQQQLKTTHVRSGITIVGYCRVITSLLLNYTGNACRAKVMGSLRKKFSSPKEADTLQLELPVIDSQSKDSPNIFTDSTEVQTEFPCVHHASCETKLSLPVSDNGDEDIAVLSKLFSEELKKRGVILPDDFLPYCVKAMQQLSKNNRSNVVYNLVKGIGVIRSDNSDSCFPCKRMPMGLLEYMADFFSSKNIQQVCQCRHAIYFERGRGIHS